MRYTLSLLLITLYSFISVGHEYIYPVAFFMHNNQKLLYLVHQTSRNNLDVLLWNPNTKETQKVLLSRFTPAGLKLIPGGKGFSFIDHDTLRIKLHEKRSPKVIDFEEPLYGLTVLSWIDSSRFYFSACRGSLFGIYEGSIQGYCSCIVASEHHDCMYPQKVDDLLFYIERTSADSHKIICAAYPTPEKPFQLAACKNTQSVQGEYDTIRKDIILDMQNRSIAFLNMLNGGEGFFIEHPTIINKDEPFIQFAYHYVRRLHDRTWHDEILFNFSIPSEYLLQNSDSCLYESILPLLPVYVPHSGLAYVDAVNNDTGLNLSINFYDMQKQRTIRCSTEILHQSFFGILYDGSDIYYGGLVSEENVLPRMWLNDGVLYMDFPKLIYID